MHKKFLVSVVFRPGWRTNNYTVFILPVDDRKEQYKVCGRNGYVIFESNRPLFRAKGLRHRKPDFQLVYGKFRKTFYAERMVDAIWDHLTEEQKPN